MHTHTRFDHLTFTTCPGILFIEGYHIHWAIGSFEFCQVDHVMRVSQAKTIAGTLALLVSDNLACCVHWLVLCCLLSGDASSQIGRDRQQ